MESILSFFIDHFPDLMNMNLTASVVILFVICVRQFLKGAPKIFSYALWGIVLLRLLVPVSIESPMSFVPERTEFSSMVEVNEVLPDIQFETPQDRAQNEWVRENTPPGEPYTQVSRSFDAQTYLTFLWLFGMAVMLLWSIASYWRMRCKLKVVVPYRKGIYLADDIDSPFVMGLIHPKIYLPGSLEPWERTFILAHERHHIRRGDHIFKALGFLALTIHWFNPFVWAAFVLAGRDMEMSCDEAVIRKLGEDVRGDYSATLLNLATGKRLFAGTPLAFDEGDPTERVRNLAKWKKPAIWVILICAIVCILLAVCLLTDPVTPFPGEFQQYFRVGEKAELLSGRSDEEYAFASVPITFKGSSGPVQMKLELWYQEDAGSEWVFADTVTLQMQEQHTFRIPSGCTFAIAATAEDGNGGYAEFAVSRSGYITFDAFEHDFLTDANTKSSREGASAWTVPASTQPPRLDWGITLVPDRVSRTGATALFRYSGSIPGEEGAEVYYGDRLDLERLDENGNWIAVEELPGYEYFVGNASHPVADGYGMVHEWPNRFGELPDGTYRMGKHVTLIRPDGSAQNKVIYGTFTLPEDILTGPIPLENLPELYGAEQAMIDGCFVSEDGVARENKELFREFAQNAWNGVPGMIRHYNCSYADSFHWSVSDLSFDGNVFTLTTQENTYTFRYLKHFTGEKAWEGAEHDAFDYYVLVNDDTVTFADIMTSQLDMSDWKNPAHWTVYADFIYLPKQPQLPDGPAQAVLELDGVPLVTITDFDRLEKIWILFQDAELLGYEPKTHSVGVGLHLVLTAQSGETMIIQLDPDNDICRIGGEFVFYGAFDEPNYIEKLWYYLGIEAWPEEVYEKCPNAYRPA